MVISPPLFRRLGVFSPWHPHLFGYSPNFFVICLTFSLVSADPADRLFTTHTLIMANHAKAWGAKPLADVRSRRNTAAGLPGEGHDRESVISEVRDMATVVEHNIGEGSLQLVRLDQELESWAASELGCTIFCDPATGADYIFTPGRADAERLGSLDKLVSPSCVFFGRKGSCRLV